MVEGGELGEDEVREIYDRARGEEEGLDAEAFGRFDAMVGELFEDEDEDEAPTHSDAEAAKEVRTCEGGAHYMLIHRRPLFLTRRQFRRPRRTSWPPSLSSRPRTRPAWQGRTWPASPDCFRSSRPSRPLLRIGRHPGLCPSRTSADAGSSFTLTRG